MLLMLLRFTTDDVGVLRSTPRRWASRTGCRTTAPPGPRGCWAMPWLPRAPSGKPKRRQRQSPTRCPPPVRREPCQSGGGISPSTLTLYGHTALALAGPAAIEHLKAIFARLDISQVNGVDAAVDVRISASGAAFVQSAAKRCWPGCLLRDAAQALWQLVEYGGVNHFGLLRAQLRAASEVGPWGGGVGGAPAPLYSRSALPGAVRCARNRPR